MVRRALRMPYARHPRDFCGHAILLGNAVISSSSKRIRLVTQSSQEAEIYAYAYAAKDLRFIQQLLEFNSSMDMRLLSRPRSVLIVPLLSHGYATQAAPLVLVTMRSFSCMAASSSSASCPSLLGLVPRTNVPTSSPRLKIRTCSSSSARSSSASSSIRRPSEARYSQLDLVYR